MFLSCRREHFSGTRVTEKGCGTYIVYITSLDRRLFQEINCFELYSILFNDLRILFRPDLVSRLCYSWRCVLKFHVKMRMFPRQLHGNGANVAANIAYRRSWGKFLPRILFARNLRYKFTTNTDGMLPTCNNGVRSEDIAGAKYHVIEVCSEFATFLGSLSQR
jgi:hypothetical protein